jgi:hypothetical protein
MTNNTVLDWMIGFIDTALQLHFQLQPFVTAHSRGLPMAHSVSILDDERLLFHCGWLVNFLAAD